ncbi:hypothetical protein A3J23_01555 [Candidatus Peregrinibacteria bacterium RIFCSPLOWO2_02_FULL_48_14]|nr:MAG: hypothetical protein A3J23_01555 [Candidatus Peregrinibacteria bacterium RIFCSPLOWO2_02_FULL_48_14]
MNQVGIGELKYAKPSTQGVQIQKRSPLSRARRILQNQKTGEVEQEGQLSVDIVQREDQMIIICPIAGVEKSEIKVAIQDDVLTIRGERKPLEGIEAKEALVRELFWGTFSRSIVLPDHIDRKNINARVHEHMLIITIPKTEDFKTRIIHIENAEGEK